MNLLFRFSDLYYPPVNTSFTVYLSQKKYLDKNISNFKLLLRFLTKNGNEILFFPVIVFSTMLCNVYPVALDRTKITVVMLGYITFDSNGPKSYKWKRYSANTLVKKVVVGKEKGLFTKAVNTKYYVQWIILIYLNKYSLTSAVIEKIKLCFRHQKTFSYQTFVYPVKGGFQLLDLIITELKSHMTC